jgi:CubicO group peptidase (beta-lactamase class C family)
MIIKKNMFFLIAFSLSYYSFSQKLNSYRLDNYLDSLFTNEKAMGSVSIFWSGKELYKKSTGYLSLSEKIHANEFSKYRLGSISKTFTASIILKLIEDNKLEFKTTLAKYFPEIDNSEKITIEDLLTHKSGLFNITNSVDYFFWMEKELSRNELIKKITKLKSVFKPGSRMEYSNTNYVLLTLIIENIEKETFDKVLNDYICKPCSLKNTYIGNRININNNEAKSYKKNDKWQLNTETNMSIPLGAGSVVSTPKDTNMFFDCLFNSKIISAFYLHKMISACDGVGMGIFKSSFSDKLGYGHGGKIDGFNSYAIYFPEEKISITYASNGLSISINDILEKVQEEIFYTSKTPLFFSKKNKRNVLKKYLGVYSSEKIPIQISITLDENKLYAQATHQSSFLLKQTGENKFVFDKAGIEIVFLPKKDQLLLKQSSFEFLFKKIK